MENIRVRLIDLEYLELEIFVGTRVDYDFTMVEVGKEIKHFLL